MHEDDGKYERLKGLDGIGRSEYRKRIKKIERTVFLILSTSFMVFVVIAVLAILNEGVAKFVGTLESINLVYYFASFVVLFCGYLLRFPKWDMYIKRLGVKISRKANLAIYLSLYSMDITPGRWGRSVVSYTINRMTGVGFAQTFPAVVADLFTDYIGFAVVALAAAFFVHKYVVLSLILAFLLVVPFLFLFYSRPFEYIKKRLGHIKRLSSFFETGSLYFENHKKLGADVYLYSVAFTIPSMFLNGIAFYLVILSFGIHPGWVHLPTVIFVYSSSLLLGMVTGIPATLGVTDAALISSLSFFFPELGVTFGLASLITIFSRIVSVWFVEGFGFISLLYTFKFWKSREMA